MFPVPAERLVYWWNGDDNLDLGNWVDRIKGTQFPARTTTPTHDTDGYICSKDSAYGYFRMIPNTVDFSIGRLWKCEIDFEVVYLPTRSSQYYVPLDFGSLTDASHSFGIMSPYPYDTIVDNYKGFSNTDFSTYGTTIQLSAPLAVGDRHTVVAGVEEYDSTHDIQYMQLDGGAKVYGLNPHAQTYFDDNWNRNEALVGKGVLDNYCGGAVKIYSIKFYNSD